MVSQTEKKKVQIQMIQLERTKNVKQGLETEQQWKHHAPRTCYDHIIEVQSSMMLDITTPPKLYLIFNKKEKA